MKRVRFYSNDVCPFAYRVRLALAEKAVEHEPISVDLNAIPDWYYRLSPTGKVPLLICDEDQVWESTVINEYLEDVFPQHPLLPASPMGRARARIWIEYCNSVFQPSCCGLVFELDRQKHQPIRDALDESLEFIEQGLAEAPGPYWMGEAVTLVDLAFYPFFEHACVLSYYRGYELPSRHKRLHRWLAVMRERPSVQTNCRDADFYIEAYKPYVEGSIGH